MRYATGNITKFTTWILSGVLIWQILACNTKPKDPKKEISEKFTTGKNIVAQKYAVASAREEATLVGLKILEEGGNAFDAAVAVHFALAVVYPQAGNIGGGGFMVARTADGKYISLDFRETAPAKAYKEMYLDASGEAVADLSRKGHLASGIPGSVAGILEIHEKYGTLPLEKLMQPAIQLAREGFALTTLDTTELRKAEQDLEKWNEGNRYIREIDWVPGNKIIQEDLARTLEKIQQQGAKGFYEGETADLIVQEMQSGKGIITHEDLVNYAPVWREPLIDSAWEHKIITMGPPSSGGIALIQMLRMTELTRLDTLEWMSASFINRMAEIMKRAYADRSESPSDPEFEKVPIEDLLDEAYLRDGVKNIVTNQVRPSSKIYPGIIFPDLNSIEEEHEQTTHFSVVDAAGNAVAITTTLNSAYGSKVFVDGAGFLLNNEMDDFAAKPGKPNQFGLIAGERNAIQPGKRMVSSMTPTILEKDNDWVLVIGTPGGATITSNVFQQIVHLVVFYKTPETALSSPRFHHQWMPDKLYMEENRFDTTLTQQLISLGYLVQAREPIGRINLIQKIRGEIYAASDPRGDDMAGGGD